MKENITKFLSQKKGLLLLVLGIVLGICLLFIEQTTKQDQVTQSSSTSPDAYTTQLEEKLENIISTISGVSDPHVLITLETSVEVVYASDDSNNEEKHVVVNNSLVPVKERLPTIKGVAIICRGGDAPETKKKIIEMTCSLLGIPTNRIYVSE